MNFEVCKQLVACPQHREKHNKNFRFTMTTNGIGITDEVIDWCNKECHNVVLSLDGRKEVNDRFRVDLAGNGSYDRIVPKFQKLVKHAAARATICAAPLRITTWISRKTCSTWPTTSALLSCPWSRLSPRRTPRGPDRERPAQAV